ncbi:MAG: alkaline phosphatase [Ignavibacteria bacterium]|nr:MAG: alkaline phosphatase [Ignavibacteria bacterium]KAF0161054.1 MAG: alkaline phosphatase [Ignavibacteria bacterium]
MIKKYFSFIVFILLSTSVFCGTAQRPKNIILLIGDGMGIPLVTASVLSMSNDQFKKIPTVGLINTTAADKLVTDSAAGATALSTGYKTNNGMIGICPDGKILTNIVEIAIKNKKSTGIVATSSVTNATPAAFLSKVESRKSEFDIAAQILNSKVDFLAGAGTDFFLPKELGGKREDGKNYVDSMKAKGYEYLSDTSKASTIIAQKKFFGLFGRSALSQGNQRSFTLGHLTKSAIQLLSKNRKGFFLMVEGSQMDWAADKNEKDYLFAEQRDFNSAIEEALNFAKKDKNTLVVVLGDHDTGSLGISSQDKETGELDVVWATRYHTANFVGMFSFGPSSNQFGGIQENSDVGKKLIRLIK